MVRWVTLGDKYPKNQPRDICIDDCSPHTEGEASDGPNRVITKAFERPERRFIRGKLATIILDDLSSNCV
jgi:hypothetical protein|tara:strand:- start:16 stop:225 length:210 start_codon:yes stop_codon:yes gene_type:complete